MVVRDPKIIRKKKSQRTMIIGFQKSDSGNFYEVNTAAKLKNQYLNNYKKVTTR